MKIGASYYPEIMAESEWTRDLTTGRELGLSLLRCGEFTWSCLFTPDGKPTMDWTRRFLDTAAHEGYGVVWCTPSATPPPYLFDRWPDLNAMTTDVLVTPVGIRRHYCPSHEGYLDLCAETAYRIAQEIGSHPAIVGWQVDNELAGDGFTCWCDRCGAAFQKWLEQRYGSIDRLNEAWQTRVWSQVYTRFGQIPVPRLFRAAHHAGAEARVAPFSFRLLAEFLSQTGRCAPCRGCADRDDELLSHGLGRSVRSLGLASASRRDRAQPLPRGTGRVVVRAGVAAGTASGREAALGARAKGRSAGCAESPAPTIRTALSGTSRSVRGPAQRWASIGTCASTPPAARWNTARCCATTALARGSHARSQRRSRARPRRSRSSPPAGRLLVFSFHQHWANENRPPLGLALRLPHRSAGKLVRGSANGFSAASPSAITPT